MTRQDGSSRFTPGRFAYWQSQRGEVLSSVLFGAAYLAVALGGFAVGLSFINPQGFADCIQRVTTATENLKTQFPSGGEVPLDNAHLLVIKQCRTFLDDVLKGPTPPGNSAAQQNLRNLINQGLQGLGTCSLLTVDPTNPEAGLTRAIYVSPKIPLAGPGANATASMTVGGRQFSAALDNLGASFFSGYIAIPTDVSRDAGGEVSQVVVTASSPIPLLSDGTCVPGSTPQGGQCIVSCTTAPKNVVWENPPVPEIRLFLVAPSTILQAQPTPIGLTWIVKNALSVSINQGVGEVDKKAGIVFELPPDQDTTYTLTAFGVRAEDTKTATQKVTVKESKPLAVSITSPGSGLVTATSVAVTGTVSPAPSAPGSLTASISVNGVPKFSVPVDGAGNFSGAVALEKTTTDLRIVNPNLTVNGCGDRSTSVVVENVSSLADVTNVIAVTVTDGSQQASASVTVFHAVLLNSFRVNWLSCAPLNKNEVLGIILGPNQSAFVGTVDCGCKNAPGGCHDVCTVRVTVGTSIGTGTADATWVFNVASCP